MSGTHHRQDTAKAKVHEENLTNPVFTRHFQNNKHSECFKVDLRLLTDADSSHFPLACHTALQIYQHTHRLTAPLWLPPCTQYTHHNDLARPTPCCSIYLLHNNLPLGLTAHCLCHCGVARAPLPVCRLVCLSLCQKKANGMNSKAWNGVKGVLRSLAIVDVFMLMFLCDCVWQGWSWRCNSPCIHLKSFILVCLFSTQNLFNFMSQSLNGTVVLLVNLIINTCVNGLYNHCVTMNVSDCLLVGCLVGPPD